MIYLSLFDRITDDVVKETYHYGKELGKGASGTVQEVTHRKSKKKYALKIIHKDDNINDIERYLISCGRVRLNHSMLICVF